MKQTLGQKLLRIKPAEEVATHADGAEGKSLERSLGVFSLAMIGVGATIGTGHLLHDGRSGAQGRARRSSCRS